MPDLNVNRVNAYAALFRLSRSFNSLAESLTSLGDQRILKPKQVATLRALAGELQSDINFHVLEVLHQLEQRDWDRLGKVRIQREKGDDK